jgi:type II secretory pathway component GspD/PulD (secretin)
MNNRNNSGVIEYASKAVKFFLLMLMIALCACSASMPSVHKDLDLTALLEKHKSQNQSIDNQKNRPEIAISKLEVTKNSTGDGFMVSVDARDMDAFTAVNSLLERTGVNFVFNKVSITGFATLRFEKRPLLEALNLLLNPLGVECTLKDHLYIFQNSGDTISAEYHLKNIKAETAIQVLEGLYPRSASSPSPLKYTSFTNSQTISIQGPPAIVDKLVTVLKRADQKPSHVLIESLVVECDSDALEKIGTDISNASSGTISGASSSFAPDSLSRAMIFTKAAASSNPAVFTAAIDLLIHQSRARLISRPYLATISGEKAAINITNDRHVVVQTSDNGATVSTTTPISSGIILEVTPTVSSEGQIRMEVTVEDSGFVPADDKVAVEVDKNRAKTTMQVESGRSIIVGGLTLSRRSSVNSGFPWLRNIPLLNILFAHQEESMTKKEVLIFLTPYIWSPDMANPMKNLDAFEIKKENDGIYTPFEQLKSE